MERISLKDNYISVCQNGVAPSFGGSQEWFADAFWGNISRQGCGIIAAVDTMLYLIGNRSLDGTDYASEINTFKKECKLPRLFLHEFGIRKYDNFSFAIGILPFQMSRYLNRRSLKFNSKYHFKWNGIHGHKDMYQKMKSMISNNIPVVWSLYSRKKEIRLYELSQTQNDFICKGAHTNNHYVTVTGIVEDPSSLHKRMIEISSWGKRFYIDYDEYLEYVGKSLISRYCSNILYTK